MQIWPLLRGVGVCISLIETGPNVVAAFIRERSEQFEMSSGTGRSWNKWAYMSIVLNPVKNVDKIRNVTYRVPEIRRFDIGIRRLQ